MAMGKKQSSGPAKKQSATRSEAAKAAVARAKKNASKGDIEAAKKRVTVKDHDAQVSEYAFNAFQAILLYMVLRLQAVKGCFPAALQGIENGIHGDEAQGITAFQIIVSLKSAAKASVELAGDMDLPDGSKVRTRGIMSIGLSIKEAKAELGDLKFIERMAAGTFEYLKQVMFQGVAAKDQDQKLVHDMRCVVGLAAKKGPAEDAMTLQGEAAKKLRTLAQEVNAEVGANTVGYLLRKQRDQSGKLTVTMQSGDKRIGSFAARGRTVKQVAALEAFEPQLLLGKKAVIALAEAAGLSTEDFINQLCTHGAVDVALKAQPVKAAKKGPSPAKVAKDKAVAALDAMDADAVRAFMQDL